MKSTEKTNTSGVKAERMTLRDYYNSLPEAKQIAPRKVLVQRIASRCHVPESTARSWLMYGIRPRDYDGRIKSILSEETGIAPEDMWK